MSVNPEMLQYVCLGMNLLAGEAAKMFENPDNEPPRMWKLLINFAVREGIIEVEERVPHPRHR